MNSTSEVEAWPDWQFGTAVIIGTGPGAAAVPLDVVPGQAYCIAIKSTWEIAPWAQVLYGCDRGWWAHQRGVPDFKGLKFCPSPTVCKVYRDVRLVKLKTKAEILTKDRGTLGCGLRSGGGHSGFHAINLAVQFGVRRIVLVGFDMTVARGAHWRPREDGVARPCAVRVEGWRSALDACAPQFRNLGVDVVNATPGSALKAYRFASLRDAIWG